MAKLVLTSQSSMEEYSRRICYKLAVIEETVERRTQKYYYDGFLKTATTSHLKTELDTLKMVKYLIELSMQNPKKNMHVVLDESDVTLIHREEDVDE